MEAPANIFDPSIPTNRLSMTRGGSMFGAFASTVMSLNNLPSLFGRIASDGQYYDEPEDGTDLKALLDSKYTAEKAEGMKRILALMSVGNDVSEFFPQVVKNIVVRSLHLKRLVYMYISHYAQRRPEETLLAINTLQKELSDQNALVRAQALRAMASIRLPPVTPLVVMAAQKAARDPSAYVRRCTAQALPQIYAIDREQHQEALEELADKLLGDSSVTVQGAAAAALLAICPHRLHVIGSHFESLCRQLTDMDEWAHVVVLELLLRYVVGRYGAPAGAVGSDATKASLGREDTGVDSRSVEDLGAGNGGSQEQAAHAGPFRGEAGGLLFDRNEGTGEGSASRKGSQADSLDDGNFSRQQLYEDFFTDGPDSSSKIVDERLEWNRNRNEKWNGNQSANRQMDGRGFGTNRWRGESKRGNANKGGGSAPRNVLAQPAERQGLEQIKLLLQATLPLLQSRSSAVVLAAAAVYWHLAKKETLKGIIAKPLVFLLRACPDSQYVVLANIASMAQVMPSLFQEQYEDFFVRGIDSRAVRSLKLQVLTLLATERSMKAIMREFQAYVHDPDGPFVAETIQAIGSCASRLPAIAPTCLDGLLHLALGGVEGLDRGRKGGGQPIRSSRSGTGPVKDLTQDNEKDGKGKAKGGSEERKEVRNGVGEEEERSYRNGKKGRREGKEPMVEEGEENGVKAGPDGDGAASGEGGEGGGVLKEGDAVVQDDVREETRDAVVVREAILVMRRLVQQRPSEYAELTVQLARSLNRIPTAEARAAIVWMLGEYCHISSSLNHTAPIVLRHMAGRFMLEKNLTKLQILTSTAKVLLRADVTAVKQAMLLMKYVLDLSRHDASYDLRDRARMIRRLLALRGLLKTDGTLPSSVTSETGATATGNAALSGPITAAQSAELSDKAPERDWTADLVTGLSGEGVSGEGRIGNEAALGGSTATEHPSSQHGACADTDQLEIANGGHLSMGLSEATFQGLQLGSQEKDEIASGQVPAKTGCSEDRKLPSNSFLAEAAERILFPAKIQSLPGSLAPARSAFQLGSLSHLVNHRAPGYEPLPEPGAVQMAELPLKGPAAGCSRGKEAQGGDSDEEDTESGSSYSSDYTQSEDESERERGYEASGSTRFGNEGGSGFRVGAGSASEFEGAAGSGERRGEWFRKGNPQKPDLQPQVKSRPLIDLSDGLDQPPGPASSSENSWSQSPAGPLTLNLMDLDGGASGVGPSGEAYAVPSGSNLEDWLSSPGGAGTSGTSTPDRGELALGKLLGRPSRHKLLDFTNGEGLEVEYAFDRRPHEHSKHLVGVQLFFHNRATEGVQNIWVNDPNEEAANHEEPAASPSGDPESNSSAGHSSIIPAREVQDLGPGQACERTLYVDFQQRLRPVALAVHCGDKVFPVKVAPEVGSLLRPRVLRVEAFLAAEARLRGMHETKQRCILTGRFPKNHGPSFSALEAACIPFARAAAQKILDAAHLYLVSASTDGGALRIMHKWQLRFSGETLATNVLCLLTVANDGAVVEEGDDRWHFAVQVKVNCEDTVLGLSLLKSVESMLGAL